MAIITHIDISALHYVTYFTERKKRENFFQIFLIGEDFKKLKRKKQNKILNSYPQTITYHAVGSTCGVKVNFSCQ